MENKKLLEKLSQMRKNFVADRVRDKQDLVYVEEKGRALLSFRRSENGVIMSGDKRRLKKIQEADPVIINYLRNLFLGPEEEEEMEFGTDEDRVTPKMFIPKQNKTSWRQTEWVASPDLPQFNRLLLNPIRTFSFLGAFISVPFFAAMNRNNSSTSTFLQMLTSKDA